MAEIPKPLNTFKRCGALLRRALGSCAGGGARRIGQLRELAPYAVIEILLPGGSLLALILWLERRRMNRRREIPYANKPVDDMTKPRLLGV